jgi:hypothetical protein
VTRLPLVRTFFNNVMTIWLSFCFRDGANRDQANKVASCAVSRADGNADA